jgi:hypothetical protein
MKWYESVEVDRNEPDMHPEPTTGHVTALAMKKADTIRNRRPRELFTRALLLLISLFVCIALLELAMRLLDPRSPLYPKGYYRIDEESGLVCANPDYQGYAASEFGRLVIETNAYGFRGPSLDPRGEGSPRVMILGDSFVQAVQVDIGQTFGHLISESAGMNAQVMQVGMPGWGQGDQLRWLRTYYDYFRPQIVVVSVFLGNDLTIDNMGEDNLGSSYYNVTRDGYLVSKNGSSTLLARIKKGLGRQSRLYNFVRPRLRTLISRILGRDSAIVGYHKYFLPIYSSDVQARKAYYDTFFEIIRRFSALAREKDFGLIVLLIPWDSALDGSRFDAVISHFGLDRDDYDVKTPNSIIGSFMKENSIPYIDLYDSFAGKENPLEAYGKRDRHFSPTGHRWAAEELTRSITELSNARGGDHFQK